MAVYEPVEYVETVPLLVELGYDPDGISRGSMRADGYSDGVARQPWREAGHWEIVKAAIDRDEVGSRSSSPVDEVNHPTHYTSGPECECGRVIECITVIRDRRLSIGVAMKYLWRNGLKRDADKTATEKQIQDLRKAVWFIEDEIAQLERAKDADEKGARDGAR